MCGSVYCETAGSWCLACSTKHLMKMNVPNAVWMFLHKTIIATVNKILKC